MISGSCRDKIDTGTGVRAMPSSAKCHLPTGYYCTTSINTDNPNSRYLRPSTLRPAQDLCQGVLVLSIHGKVGRVRYRAIVLPTLAKVVVKHRDRRCYDIVRHPWTS